MKQQIKRIARLVEARSTKQDAGQWWKAEATAEKVGDDVILQQINAEEAAEIEHEHTIVPDSEVDDHVAENVLIYSLAS